MTTGLVEGWQRFADDLRPEHPLLSAARWVEVLRETGFEAADAWPRQGSAAGALGQHVVVARVAGEALGTAERPDLVAAAPAGEAPRPPAAAEEAALLRGRIAEALPMDRLDLLRGYVRDRVVQVLRLDADEPPARNARLMDLGFDSLMAVQLRNQLGTGLALERPLPASLLFDHPTIDALAARLQDLLAPPAAAEAAVPAASAARERMGAAAVEKMTEAEVEALLLERLGKR